jgi:hypothetical protein
LTPDSTIAIALRRLGLILYRAPASKKHLSNFCNLSKKMFISLSFSQELLFAKVLPDKMPNKRKNIAKRSLTPFIPPPQVL